VQWPRAAEKKAGALAERGSGRVRAWVRGSAESAVDDALHVVHIALVKIELSKKLEIHNRIVRLPGGGVAIGQTLQLLQNERDCHPVRVMHIV